MLKQCIATLVVIALGLSVSACGSSQAVVRQMDRGSAVLTKFRVETIDDHSGSAVPSTFLTEIRSYLESDLTQHHLNASEGEAANRIRIEVVSYRMRGGVTRAMFGMMAGKDGVESKVTVLPPTAPQVLGETNISTYNVMAVGGADDIARMHADAILKFLTGETKK
ncbi:MAG: DUF4410 domain-containing protein [Gammaproteobacteria bacterium]|nr:MAG: DUF4410 domain-containing protein [Gammaproteobacteria bacterium]